MSRTFSFCLSVWTVNFCDTFCSKLNNFWSYLLQLKHSCSIFVCEFLHVFSILDVSYGNRESGLFVHSCMNVSGVNDSVIMING